MKSINNRLLSRILIWKVPLAVLLGVLTLAIAPLQSIAQQMSPSSPTTYWPTQGWQSTITPEEGGFDSAKLAEALLTIREQDIDIHSLLVIQNGAVVVDAYFYPYDGSTFHDVASVTKSIMTTLIGIAADQGKLELDQPMLSYFPNNNNTIANLDALKERITVRHLASMSSGLNCTQEGDEATLREMKASPDWVRFTLDRKVIWEPGTTFVYCSPGMHLLSAILQHVTGMTALDFARQNLFEPLGIRDVMWLTDPQGYNRGSEGVYLHPYDMAKIGYLWLNNGQWEGKQIVSQEWVNNSVKAQFETGEEGDDDYGYGWWVQTDDEPESHSASGRGGQRIIVVPAWNLIIATTGGGFSFEEIESLLAATIVDMNNSLPANPSAASKLQAALTAISQPPAARPIAPLPDTAHIISGKTFVFEPNPLGIEKVQLEFNNNNNNSSEAMLHVTLTDGGQMPPWPIGLDGVYRLSPGEYNLPQGNRGHWIDAQTFMLEHDEIANNDHILLLMHFTGDRVMVEGQETAHELGVRLEGRIQG